LKKKRKEQGVSAAACQLRTGSSHPFGMLKGFVPLGTGEERVYRELREAVPVLDAAVGKLVRLSGGFQVKCRSAAAQKKLEEFLRTVPCGGARHQFETYLLVRNVEGLENGAYHYLPMEHALEFLHPVEDLEAVISGTLCGQTWAAKANVVFYWSMVAYRVEWRYGIYAHRAALLDAGHIGQNLYLACTGLDLGCCAIASFSHERCCEIFRLDGEEEYIIYTMPVGTVREMDKAQEQAFYSFVQDDEL